MNQRNGAESCDDGLVMQLHDGEWAPNHDEICSSAFGRERAGFSHPRTKLHAALNIAGSLWLETGV